MSLTGCNVVSSYLACGYTGRGRRYIGNSLVLKFEVIYGSDLTHLLSLIALVFISTASFTVYFLLE